MSNWRDFQQVRQQGISKAGRYIVLSTLPAPHLPHWQYGIITSKKTGKAHQRNRIRRLVRETLVRHGASIQEPAYLVIIARWRAKEATFRDIEQDWLRLTRQLGLTKPPEPTRQAAPRQA